ncbi:threonine dehydrogenase-like Zn-dependent dehydrogenase [Kribbella amoyensis]|uniref:Threonine dehydrogenase-like Zn-dependent dehydrogenase n=1 Tax=Kribbella amoyensis TaxID=996641 RepID=A0A561BJD5_9ACTN|nr:zinc-binding dehydrogenase [Kribbella amoyensis]TWD78974.1 threonine dehydrogenase-like Zn-dependent dehydrogenase [Kribbella amoyensis]
MTASVYELVRPGAGRLVPQQVPSPGHDQVVVRVHTVGVCASDLPTWAGEQPAYPVQLGHEPVGEVIAAGAGAGIAIGALVGGRIFPSFATYALADAADVVVIPAGVDPAVALPEPVGCVVEGYRRTPLAPGASVAVIGGGFMGLVMVQLLASSLVSDLIVVDPRADARAAAAACGADRVYEPATVPDGLRYHLDSQETAGVDVVIEVSGSQAGLDLAGDLVRPHGVLSILGYHQGARQVNLQDWNWKALEVVNAHVRDRRLLREATLAGLRLQQSGRLDLRQLVTHRFPADRIDEAFETLRSKPHGFIKSVVDLG